MNEIHSYPIAIYRGDDDGTSNPSGTVYWAVCRDLDCMGDGTTQEEALADCRSGIELNLRIMRESGKAIPAPSQVPAHDAYSGRFVVRLAKSLHRLLAEEAEEEGISLNQYIAMVLASRHGHRSVAMASRSSSAISAGLAVTMYPPQCPSPEPSNVITFETFSSARSVAEG